MSLPPKRPSATDSEAEAASASEVVPTKRQKCELSYDSLQAVVRHLSIFKRLTLCHRSPLVQTVHNKLPTTINLIKYNINPRGGRIIVHNQSWEINCTAEGVQETRKKLMVLYQPGTRVNHIRVSGVSFLPMTVFPSGCHVDVGKLRIGFEFSARIIVSNVGKLAGFSCQELIIDFIIVNSHSLFGSKLLTCSQKVTFNRSLSLRALRQLPNQSIQLSAESLKPMELLEYIQDWIRRKRPAGSTFSMQIKDSNFDWPRILQKLMILKLESLILETTPTIKILMTLTTVLSLSVIDTFVQMLVEPITTTQAIQNQFLMSSEPEKEPNILQNVVGTWKNIVDPTELIRIEVEYDGEVPETISQVILSTGVRHTRHGLRVEEDDKVIALGVDRRIYFEKGCLHFSISNRWLRVYERCD